MVARNDDYLLTNKEAVMKMVECEKNGHPTAVEKNRVLNYCFMYCPDCNALYTKKISVTQMIRRRRRISSGRLERVLV